MRERHSELPQDHEGRVLLKRRPWRRRRAATVPTIDQDAGERELRGSDAVTGGGGDDDDLGDGGGDGDGDGGDDASGDEGADDGGEPWIDFSLEGWIRFEDPE